MAESVRTADLQRLLAVIDATWTGHAADGLPTDVLEQARDLVPCDGVALGEFDPTRQRGYLHQARPADEVEVDPGIFFHHYWDSAHCSYPDRSGDLLSVTTKTLYRHMRDGTVGSVRVGPRLLRIPHTELVAFLQIRSKKKAG